MKETNFVWLFGGLMALLAVEPATHYADLQARAALEGAFMSFVLIGVWSLRSTPRWFGVALTLAAIDLVVTVAYLTWGGTLLHVLNYLATSAFCTVCAGLATRSILAHPHVGGNHLMGAASVYLLLGVIWTGFFAIARTFDPGALSNLAVPQGAVGELGDLLYFSFVTLTTLGYGDVAPLSPLARSLAYMEAIVGQLYLAVLVAALIGRLAQPAPGGTVREALPSAGGPAR